ncbi:alcohol dehydrogenase [Pochonia chlamydosporia 170]|uniref:Alcohol dehydrogenase n=1 Tax=Pochonia chlamydosporia 170 TaxID=1380566 RepID=A0A179FLJ6_METCM|nr:alcohol dehydrogenase [Pochonia chlamydosporia 170]OAQ65913.1 alcohol dehydrogenase [Pochonia chlamydosporia 170]
MATCTKYSCPSQSAPLTASPFPIHAPSPTQVQVRIKAIAINPADTKMIDHSHRGTTYPLIPGLDGAGIISAVGSSVTSFKVGDEVLALFAPGDKGGSYQEYALVDEAKVAKKSGLSFEEAASLGVSYFTAVMGLGIGLGMSLPFIPGTVGDGFVPKTVLVLGGSSALGAASILLLRLAVPSCRILATGSKRHLGHITDYLGADVAIDRNSGSLVADIRASTEGGKGIDAIIDTVGAGAEDSSIFEVFESSGPKKYAQVWTGEDEIRVPEGVESVLFRSRDFGLLQGGTNIMQGLQTLLEKGQYKPPLPVRIVGTGINGLNQGLNLMRKGVSGEKLVVSL